MKICKQKGIPKEILYLMTWLTIRIREPLGQTFFVPTDYTTMHL